VNEWMRTQIQFPHYASFHVWYAKKSQKQGIKDGDKEFHKYSTRVLIIPCIKKFAKRLLILCIIKIFSAHVLLYKTQNICYSNTCLIMQGHWIGCYGGEILLYHKYSFKHWLMLTYLINGSWARASLGNGMGCRSCASMGLQSS